MEINREEKKIVIKIVYYGPALSGKTTNLMQLHDLLSPSETGDLMSLDTKGDRTLFFDLLPMVISTDNGFRIKLKIFTVPGQVAHDATRKAVLSRADGVVFVADSQKDQAINNLESFENLEKNAARVGLDFENLPLLIQFNKRDLEDIDDEETILNKWTPTGIPVVFAKAIYGQGVFESFYRIMRDTCKTLDRSIQAGDNFSISESIEKYFRAIKK